MKQMPGGMLAVGIDSHIKKKDDQVEPNNRIIVISLAVQEMSKDLSKLDSSQAHTKLQGSQILVKLYALNENKFIRFNLCRQSWFLSGSFCFQQVAKK